MNLKKISLIVALVGILLLILLLEGIPPRELKISEIEKSDINKKVFVIGEITNIKSYDDFKIISLKDETGTIEVILNSKENLTMNQTISVYGVIKEYEQTLQIQADKIAIYLA